MKKVLGFALCALVVLSGTGLVLAETIYDVQYSTLPDYVSPLVGSTVNVYGGIVTKVRPGYRTRIVIQDPSLGPAWAGVLVSVDSELTPPDVQRGDQVDFLGVLVEEYRGYTQLYYDSTSTCVVNSSGNPVAPLIVSTAEIPYPPNPALSEKYEFMLLKVEGVSVGAMDLGCKGDNYQLTRGEGTCYASDYANYDLPPDSNYYVSAGACYLGVTGCLEEYTSDTCSQYQLLPRDAGDFVAGASAVEGETWTGIKAFFR